MRRHAAIYIRVSTDSQAEEGYSIDAQREQLTAYCIAKGIKEYELYIDGGFTGSNIDRPELKRLINDCKQNKITSCLVYKLDRLSRSQKDTLYLIEDVFNMYNVDFISLTESLDTSTPVGRLMIGILSAFAQLERENIKMRTRMGMTERVKSGLWMGGGRVPYGYDYDSDKGILIPNKDAEKVKKMYQMYLDGYSTNAIAKKLNLKYEKLCYQILKRKTNIGVIEYNGVEYKGKHEPIIDEETYYRTLREIEKRSTNNSGYGNKLLTGLIYCGNCGAKMRYQKYGKKGDMLICYSTVKSSKSYLIKDENCKQKKILASVIEQIVISDILQFRIPQQDTPQDEIQNKSVGHLLLQDKIKIENKIKRLYNIYADSEDKLLLETITELKNELKKIEEKIKEDSQFNNSQEIQSATFDILENIGQLWEISTFQEKKTILNALIDKIIITDENVEIRYKI